MRLHQTLDRSNSRMRDELLNVQRVLSMPQMRLSHAIWRRDDTVDRPHSSLGNLTPQQFARHLAG
ncbi:transposase (plasmid) [Deinococcus taeanensis]|uniref:transposase n=1 Tax=Deinococcus taeanensis TaxID=2737050 RepID=UPI001CDC4F43|nr:transposase [Deinococcus taeanensis]